MINNTLMPRVNNLYNIITNIILKRSTMKINNFIDKLTCKMQHKIVTFYDNEIVLKCSHVATVFADS